MTWLFPRPFLLGFLLFALVGGAQADPRGQANLGVQYDGWNAATTLPFNGSEIFIPFSISYGVDPHWYLSGQTSFASGSYTDSLAGTETLDLTALTQSVVTSDYYFTDFGVNNMFEVSLTMPTGDPSWETEEVASNIPTIFINTRYQSEGWGLSGLYAISFPAGKNLEYGLSAGYSYTGPYDPGYGDLTGVQLKMGDSMFLALNRVESFAANQSGTFRFSAMAFLPTTENGQNDFQLGPNLTASYTYYDPQGISWSLGALLYSFAQRYFYNPGGYNIPPAVVYGQEPYGSLGQRFYFSPSYIWGNLTLSGLIQYVTADGYPINDYSGLYNGGGFVFGLTPTYLLNLDAVSALSFNGGYDFIIAHDGSAGFTQDVDYNYWTLGATYQVKIF
jgi:hypothetical protein